MDFEVFQGDLTDFRGFMMRPPRTLRIYKKTSWRGFKRVSRLFRGSWAFYDSSKDAAKGLQGAGVSMDFMGLQEEFWGLR